MRFQVNAIFALQTRQGLVFGCARDIDGDHLVFQVPGAVMPGEVLDWRMQLVGRPEMVLGALRVESQRPGPTGEHPIFDGRIIVMTEQNRALLQSWLQERSESTSREHVPLAESLAAKRGPPKLGSSIRRGASYRIGKPSAPTPRPQAEKSNEPSGGREAITAAIKQSLSKIANRQPVPKQRPVFSNVSEPANGRAAARHESGRADAGPRLNDIPRLEPIPRQESAPRPAPAPPLNEHSRMFDPSRSGTEPVRGGEKLPRAPVGTPVAPGQAPVTQVRFPSAGEPVRTRGAEPAQGAPSGRSFGQGATPPPWREPAAPPREPAALPRKPAADPEPGKPFLKGTDPVIGVKVGAGPVQILVRYRSAATFQRDYQQHLCGSGLLLPVTEIEALRERGAAVLVRLDLPSGGNVTCRGEVVAQMSTGTGFHLMLTPKQLQELAIAAGRS